MVKLWRLYRNQLIYFSVNSQFSLTEIGREWVNPFLLKVAILHLTKTTENQRFSGIFRRYKIGTLAGYELIYFCSGTLINCCYSCITFGLNERSEDRKSGKSVSYAPTMQRLRKFVNIFCINLLFLTNDFPI